MQTVKIRLRKPARVLTFRCGDDVPLLRHDACIVRTDQGLEYGLCVLPPEPCSQEVGDRYQMELLRKVTDEDKTTLEQVLIEEARAHRICAARIAERNLPMRLVDAGYTFDQNKVVFYFVAEQRVDFRELVRDLAHSLKARIEMRHIQVRDQAMMVGGIGGCGRLLCCHTFLHEFMPISMKMAKRQNLSMNPEKISGQCGRLMCCLAYEADQYAEKKKKTPPPAASAEDPADAGETDEHVERDATSGRANDGAPSAGQEDEQRKKARRRRKRRKKPGQGGAEAPSSPAP